MTAPGYVLRFTSVALLAASGAATAESAGPMGPPGFTMTRTGSMRDFDYFQGAKR
jgi:hypothetical protein